MGVSANLVGPQTEDDLLSVCGSQGVGLALTTGCGRLAAAMGWRRAAVLGIGGCEQPDGVLATFGCARTDPAAWAVGTDRPEVMPLRCFGRLVGYAMGRREGPPSEAAAEQAHIGALATLVALAVAAAGPANPPSDGPDSLLGALVSAAGAGAADSPALTPILTQPHRFQLSGHLPADAVLVADGRRPAEPREWAPAPGLPAGPLFDALLPLAPGIILVTEGADHRIAVTNPLAQAAFPGRFAVGDSLRRILADLQDDYLPTLDLAFRTGLGSDRLMAAPRGRDERQERLWSVAIRPYRRPDGPIQGLVLVATETLRPIIPPAEGDPNMAPTESASSGEDLFDRCGVGFILISLPDLRVVRHNAAMVPLLGGEARRRGTAVGMSATDLLDPATWADLGPALRQVVATGAPAHLGELRAVFAEETEERVYHCTLAPVYGPDAALSHVVASAMEVTEHARARALLQSRAEDAEQRAEELRQALDVVDDGVVLFDAAGETVWRNAASARLFAPAPRPGHYLTIELRAPNGQWVPAAARPVSRALAGGVVDNEPYLVRHSEGGTTVVSVSAQPLRGQSEVRRGAVLLLRDRDASQSEVQRMTDLAGVATRRSDALAAVIASLSDGVMITDAANDALVVNRAFCDLFGVEAVPKTLKHRIADLQTRHLDGTPLEPQETPSARAMAGETVVGVRLLYRHRRGHDLVVEVSASPVREAGGRIAGSVCALRDVTRSQRLMDERDDFISVAAHELRTPLTAILLETQMLARAGARGQVPEGWGPHVQRLSASSERLKKLVDGLMDVSRLERGIVTLTTERHDLARLACAAAERFRQLHPAHPLRARLDLVLALVDPVRFDQLLDNLLDNAAKYCPPGTPIEIGLTADVDTAVLTVADRGRGLPDADLDRVFTRYYRADLHPARRYTGLGLGLFLARQIAELHGGEIAASNRGGGGLRVTVRLPAVTPS